jgi:hypothetical protein
MAEASESIRQILERIRRDAERALSLLPRLAGERSLAWKCDRCGHVKHFTRPCRLESRRRVRNVLANLFFLASAARSGEIRVLDSDGRHERTILCLTS